MIPTLKTKFDHKDELNKVKIKLMTQSTFLSSMCFDMEHIFTPNLNPPTAATDGLKIYYHPEFWEKISREERIGLVAHEIWHVAWDHLTRLGDRDPKIWNYAGDYVINLMLTQQGFQLPEGALLEYKYAGKSTEEVYRLLEEEEKKNPGSLPGSDMIGDIKPKDMEDLTDQEKQQLKEKITDMVSKAKTKTEMENGKEWGNMPDDFKRYIDELLDPKLSWQEILMKYMDSYTKGDYSYVRPNKRFMPGVYLPTQNEPTIGELTVAIDTSGSITDKELQEILSEVENIRRTHNPTKLTMIACDTRVHEVHEVDQFTDITALKFTGGGGTSFKPVLDLVKKNPPAVLLYFTDLWAENITDEPGFDTIWICNSDHPEQGIGETIYF